MNSCISFVMFTMGVYAGVMAALVLLILAVWGVYEYGKKH